VTLDHVESLQQPHLPGRTDNVSSAGERPIGIGMGKLPCVWHVDALTTVSEHVAIGQQAVPLPRQHCLLPDLHMPQQLQWTGWRTIRVAEMRMLCTCAVPAAAC
jgi:hypothetical protein